MNYNVAPYALGAILLGIIGITFHDFHMQWQAVPETSQRTPYAYVSAAILASRGLRVARAPLRTHRRA